MDGFEEKESGVKTEKLNVPKSRKLVSDPEIRDSLMLPMDYDEAKLQLPVYIQPKLNGIFAIWHAGKQGLYTKDGKRWRDWLPEHLGLVGVKDTLAMELYNHGMSLQEISSAIGVNNLEKPEAANQIFGFVFDTIRPGSFDERIEYLEDRCGYLRRFPQIKPVSLCYTSTLSNLNERLEINRNSGYEGSIIRYKDGQYTPGKSWLCMKQKNWRDAEVDVIGLTEGEGKSANNVGSMQVRSAEGKEFTVGTFRISYADRKKMWLAGKPYPRVKVQWLNDSADGIPLNTSVTQVLED